VVIDAEFWARLVGISFLNLLLSGDNALVIALAVRALPRRQRLLGQVWGAVGAVVLRLAFVAVVTLLLRAPFLKLVGGLLLVWIAVKLVRPGAEEGGDAKHGTSLWEAIWIIVVADVTMSLDNVLAIAAASRGNIPLVAIGIAMSIPIVIWGSGILASHMNRHVWIIWLGGGILGYVAGDMMLEDPVVAGWLGESVHALERLLPISAGSALTALGWWFARAARGDRA
jgi:YjbE family integral membrane protein